MSGVELDHCRRAGQESFLLCPTLCLSPFLKSINFLTQLCLSTWHFCRWIPKSIGRTLPHFVDQFSQRYLEIKYYVSGTFVCDLFRTDLKIWLCVHACMLSCFTRVQLCAILLTVACQTPPSSGFSRQEYWSGLPFPPPGDLPNPGIEPVSLASLALAGRFFTPSTTRWAAITRIDFGTFSSSPREIPYTNLPSSFLPLNPVKLLIYFLFRYLPVLDIS